jgi:hypothetical protein
MKKNTLFEHITQIAANLRKRLDDFRPLFLDENFSIISLTLSKELL